MKRAIIALLMCALPAAGTINSDGQGFFPVLVQVLAEDRSPVRGAEVSLTDFRRRTIPPAAAREVRTGIRVTCVHRGPVPNRPPIARLSHPAALPGRHGYFRSVPVAHATD